MYKDIEKQRAYKRSYTKSPVDVMNDIPQLNIDNVVLGLEMSNKGWQFIISNVIYFASFSDVYYRKV